MIPCTFAIDGSYVSIKPIIRKKIGFLCITINVGPACHGILACDPTNICLYTSGGRVICVWGCTLMKMLTIMDDPSNELSLPCHFKIPQMI